jgi:hypothetical protein
MDIPYYEQGHDSKRPTVEKFKIEPKQLRIGSIIKINF